MIVNIISKLELKAIYRIREEEERISSILKLKTYLSKIDFEMEDIPMIDVDTFKNLLESLKGSKLDKGEEEIINEIMNNTDSNSSTNRAQ